MKVSVGVLAVCLALCHASCPGFKDGKKYIYDYNVKFGTGVSDDAVTQLAGKGMQGKLHVYHTDNHLVAELHDVKVADFNKRMHNVYEVLDLDYQKPTDADEIKACEGFEKPWYAEYGSNGKIVASKHLAFKDNVQTNIQRAILSLFQIVFPEGKPHDHYYVVDESGIGGDCKASYLINHFHPDECDENEDVMNITKNFQYDHCTYQPHMLFSSMVGYDCKNCKEENFKSFRNIARVEYGIKGTRAEYTIEDILATGYIGYTPFTTNGQTVASITNQTLHLVGIEDVTPAAVSGDAMRIEGLYFTFNIEEVDFDKVDLKENIDLDRVYPHKYVLERFVDKFGGEKDQIVQATSLLPKLTPKKFEDYKEIAQVTALLGNVLLGFDYDDFTKFFSQNINMEAEATPEEKDRRNFILKVLTLVGTNPANYFALEQIRSGKVPEKIQLEMISTMPLYAKTPAKPLVEEFRKFVKSDFVQADHDKLMYSVAWEAYGTLIFSACVKDDYNNHPPRKETFISAEHCKEYIKDFVDACHATERSEDKCVLVRGLKNTRTDAAFHILVDEVIPSGKYNEYIRGAAIWGLEHYMGNEKYDHQINKVLLPIFSDINEDYQLRIYAFDILLYVNQHARFFSNLLLMVNEEPSNQVASYIVSSLSSIANSTDPCHEEIAKHARHILPEIERQAKEFDFLRHSTNKIFNYHNEQYGFGRTTQLAVIGGNNTAIPREVYLRQSFNMDGRNFDFLELGFLQRNNHGIDTFLAAILEQYSLMYAPKIGGEDYGFAKHFDAENFLSKMSSEIYTRIFNQDVAVMHKLDVPNESAYFTKLGPNKVAVHYTKVISAAQVEYVIPNMIGLPTYLHLLSPAVVKLCGTLSYEADKPDLTDMPTITLTSDLKYVVDIDVRASMAVDHPMGSSGYMLRTDIGVKFPIHGEAVLDFEHHDAKSTRIISEEAYDMIYYDSQPYTFTDDTHLLAIKYSEQPVYKQYKFGHNYFGAGLKLQFTYDYYWNDFGSYRTFFKTFFHKSTRYEDYYSLIDRYYAGTRGLLDYAVINPTARPFHFRARFERATTNPTEEVVTHYKTNERYVDEVKSDGKQAWTTHKCELDITAKGPQERKWEMELEVDAHWPEVDYRRVKFHWKRTPIPGYDDKPYEVCYNSETHIHGLGAIIANPLHPAKESKVECQGTLTCGQDCSGSAKKITFKGELTKSKEQQTMDHEKLHIYKKCKEDTAKGHTTSYSCWKVKKDQGRLDHLTVDIEYDKNINPKVKEFFQRIYLWFRHTFYNNLQVDRDVADTGVAENHIKIDINISYHQPIADLHVRRPHELVHYHKVFVPSIVPRYNYFTTVEPVSSRFLRKSLRLQKPMCFLSGDYIFTLDGVSYKYPLGPCYHAAVANCLRENVLLAFRAVKDGKHTKAMKFVVEDSTIEVIPEGGKLVVYADGTKILDGPEPAFRKQDDNRDVFLVYRKYTKVVVESKIAGLSAYFDGNAAKIKVSNLYHGIQCGMCGDFNNEQRREFQGIDGTLYHTPAKFAHSYAIHKDGCHED